MDRHGQGIPFLFKGEILRTDAVREKVYEDVWAVLHGLKKVRG